MTNCRKCRDLKRENHKLELEVRELRKDQPKPDEPTNPPTHIGTPMYVASPSRKSVGFRNPWNTNPVGDL